jgi:hypothetical protein
MKITIIRTGSDDVQTIGKLIVTDDNCKKVLERYALELPDKDNKFQVSRIPAGEYKVIKRWSPKYKNHFHILDVPNRSMILIHHGNYHRDTLGCILPGKRLVDIDGDGHKDVTESVKVMKELNNILPDEFFIEIIND